MVDVQEKIERIAGWIRKQVEEAGARAGVLGLSGGIDSTVVAALCRRALGDGALGLIMPCHSSPADVTDAHLAARWAGLRTEMVDLSDLHDHFLAILPPGDRVAHANLKPRLRMTTLYYYANVRNALVVGTSNRSELAVGYFTKYGDGGADILPIGGLLKREVLELAGALGVPRSIMEKPPSAGLWEGQTDEGEMGIAYRDLDAFLSGEPVNPSTARRIRALMASSTHKIPPPPICEMG